MSDEDDGFVILDGVFHMGGDAYPAADLEGLYGPYAEFSINGYELFVAWKDMFDGASSPHAKVSLNDFRHDNWFEHVAFSDWRAAGNEVIYHWATPSDVRTIMARLLGGWEPKAGDHSGMGLRLS
jgi:hypothetical protein